MLISPNDVVSINSWVMLSIVINSFTKISWSEMRDYNDSKNLQAIQSAAFTSLVYSIKVSVVTVGILYRCMISMFWRSCKKCLKELTQCLTRGGGGGECESETTFDKKYIRSSNINNLYIDTNITLCSLYIISRPVSSICIWSENSRPKSEVKDGESGMKTVYNLHRF